MFGVVALSQLAGLVALSPSSPGWAGRSPRPTSAGRPAPACSGATGLVVFFRALSGGVMSVVAPVTAVTAAAVPVLAGLLGGNRIGPWAGAGILLALVAVVLVSAEGGLAQLRAARPASLTAPLIAGTAFGFFFVLLDRTSSSPDSRR